MKSGVKYSRKEFLKITFLVGLFIPFLQFCSQNIKACLLKITSTNHILGHKLWAKNFPKSDKKISTNILIVGAGITGLSASRYLSQNNENDFLLVEMEKNIGGNSRNGKNKHSKFPLGAHYLPIPNKEDKELIKFLEEINLILGYDEKENPILDEEQLTMPKIERIFYKNEWQNEIYPVYNILENVKNEYTIFFKKMEYYRNAKDTLGKYLFDIPLAKASKDVEVRSLDNMTFKNWLDANNFKSEELLWYLDYACRDDYGLGIDFVSAYAGIHYFAARKNNFTNNYNSQEFTWQEGNARLVKHLSIYTENKTFTNHLVFNSTVKNHKVYTMLYDEKNKKTITIESNKVIFATPQFVNQYIFKNRKIHNFTYVPWFIATITLTNDFGLEEELAWDNVIYKGKGLGYIYNQHQNLNQVTDEKVISYYYSFNEKNTKYTRKKLYNLTEKELKNIIIDDLKKAHYYIEDFIISIEFHKLGHGMICPVPNHIFGKDKDELQQSIENKIFFAHSDLSGISIFEEAFHQGIEVAKKCLNK